MPSQKASSLILGHMAINSFFIKLINVVSLNVLTLFIAILQGVQASDALFFKSNFLTLLGSKFPLILIFSPIWLF